MSNNSHVVLVVEDEPFILEDTAEHLRECGFAVIESQSADAAVLLLQEHAEIDLVFTDVRLPGKMDGLDLARWVFENTPHIPVMIATGDLGRVTAMHELGGAETFMKPYDHNKVAERIRHALSKKSGAPKAG